MMLYSFDVEGEMRVGSLRFIYFERRDIAVLAPDRTAGRELVIKEFSATLEGMSKYWPGEYDDEDTTEDVYGKTEFEFFTVGTGKTLRFEVACGQRTDGKWVASYDRIRLDGYETKQEAETALLKAVKLTALRENG